MVLQSAEERNHLYQAADDKIPIAQIMNVVFI